MVIAYFHRPPALLHHDIAVKMALVIQFMARPSSEKYRFTQKNYNIFIEKYNIFYIKLDEKLYIEIMMLRSKML